MSSVSSLCVNSNNGLLSVRQQARGGERKDTSEVKEGVSWDGSERNRSGGGRLGETPKVPEWRCPDSGV